MNTRKAFLSFFTLVLMSVVMLPAARADEWSQETKLTFSQPVAIPGQILPAGTYSFSLLDSPSNREIVQIVNEDRTKLYATLNTVPSSLMEPKDNTVITFAEQPSGQPAAILTWFYPGELDGHQFIYSRQQQRELDADTKIAVTAIPSGSVSDQTRVAGD